MHLDKTRTARCKLSSLGLVQRVKGTEVLLQIGPFFFSKIHLFIRLSIFFGSYMVMITLLSSMSFSVIDSGVCFVINVPHESNAFAFCLCRLCSYPPQLLDRLGTPTGS